MKFEKAFEKRYRDFHHRRPILRLNRDPLAGIYPLDYDNHRRHLLCGAVPGIQPDHPREALAEMRGWRRHHYRHRVCRRLYCKSLASDGCLGLFLSPPEPVRSGVSVIHLFMGAAMHPCGLFGPNDEKSLPLTNPVCSHAERARRLNPPCSFLFSLPPLAIFISSLYIFFLFILDHFFLFSARIFDLFYKL